MSEPAYRIEGRPVDDRAFYAAACDPRRSVVVEACAGAGKTWMLVSRVLRALLDGVEPRQILAITFTRKAAGEMRGRLDEWLHTLRSGHASEQARVQALIDRGLAPAEAARVAPQLATLHDTLLRGGRSVPMSTFHAWFAQLLARAPLAVLEQLGLPPRHQLLEDTAVLRDALMARLHRRVQADATLRGRYVALVARHRRTTVLDWLQAAWARGPEIARADAAGTAAMSVPPAHTLDAALRGLDHPGRLLHHEPYRGDIAALLAHFATAKGKKAQDAAGQLEAALRAADPEAALALAADALLTKQGDPRQQLGASPLIDIVTTRLHHLQALQRQQHAHEDQGHLLALTHVLLAEYAALKRERQLVDMPDLERAAERLLGDPALAGWLQEQLDQQLRLVLIDEFQDTNPLQWQVLQGWLGAYAGAGGGSSGREPPTLFIVGDPKQSIYRFRGAEPRVFDAAVRFVREGLGGTLLACDHTRRNAPAVIEAVNATFTPAALHEGWGPFRAHSTGSSAAGRVLRLAGVQRPPKKGKAASTEPRWRDSLTEPRAEPEQRLRALEAGQIAHAVAALLREHGLAPAEVMVLARRRATLALVAQALAALGVPHAVAEPLVLKETPEVLDLAAVLDVLVSPGHDISLARALKSPLFGAGDAELLQLATAARAARLPWLEVLVDGAGGVDAAALPPALARAAGLLRRWQALLHRLTPHELLDRIVQEGELLPRLAAAVPPTQRAAALHAVQAFVAAALHDEGGRLASAYGLLRALRAGRLRAFAAEPAGAVQLLTVHGAKGLEARAVLVADCDPEARPAERALVLVDWPVGDAAPRRVAFVRDQATLAPSLRALWDGNEAAIEREETNGLYVAATRAREWLVLSCTEPYQRRVGAAPSWWHRMHRWATLWEPPQAAADVDGELAGGVDGATSVPVPQLPALLPHLRAATEAPAAAPARSDERAARLGTAVHRVLEWSGSGALAAARGDLAAASRAAAHEAGLAAADAAAVQAIAARVLASPDCARFFSGPQLRWAGNEVPLAWQGALLRLDRLVALASPEGAGLTWWVLDYKLTHDPRSDAALHEQLARYVAAVRALQPGDAVRGAFITGAGELVEVTGL